MAFTAVNINELAEAYFYARQAHLRRKNSRTWEDYAKKEEIYVIVRTLLEAVSDMGLTIVPQKMVIATKKVTLTPIRTTKIYRKKEPYKRRK